MQQVVHDLRASLLLRPAGIASILATASVVLVEIDERRGGMALLGAIADEPGSAQVVLSVIAGSVMAVVSIVFSVLVMALSLASMQFSPRILSGFLRDPISQNALGIFAGTFLYSLLALRGVRTSPPFVPSLALLGAIALALLSIGALIYFIDHIAREIQVNHLVAHIARDAAMTIEVEMPEGPGVDEPVPPPIGDDVVEVLAETSGYVQLVDIPGLAALARKRKLRIDIALLPGDFVPAGGTLARLSPAANATEALEACARAFDLGPVRTLQQDVGFGLRMIVDIGLKAISPAINDPSTCSTCIDHLRALLRKIAGRRAGTHVVTEGDRIRSRTCSISRSISCGNTVAGTSPSQTGSCGRSPRSRRPPPTRRVVKR